VRGNGRWLWRGIGAVTAGATIYVFSPERPSAPTVKEPQIGTLRMVDQSLALPELKLWGAGPPMDLQWRVVAAVPDIVEPVAKPVVDARPVRKKTSASRTPAAKPPTEQTDWRHDFVYNKHAN